MSANRYQPLFYPLINESKWLGGPTAQSTSGQWATYWLNGNVPLAMLLRAAGLGGQVEHDLGAIVDAKIDFVLSAQLPSGQLGPDPCTWPFPTMNAVRAMLMAAEGAPPARAAKLGSSIKAGLLYLLNCTKTGTSAGGIRWPSHVEGIVDYLDAFEPSSPDPRLLELAQLWRQTGVDWQGYYNGSRASEVPFPRVAVENPSHSSAVDGYYHGVNMNEGLKFAAVAGRLWGPAAGEDAAAAQLGGALRQLETYHGHPQGTWGADEFLAGRAAQRGTELCDVVEGMYSLGWSYRQLGGEALLSTLDRVERLAFNALPGTSLADMWGHQCCGEIRTRSLLIPRPAG